MISTRRGTTEQDRTAALELWRTARAAQGRRPNAEVIARVASRLDEGVLLVAEDDTLAGFALGEPSTKDEELLHLEMVIVHPDRQGAGLGTVLVEGVADLAWTLGMRRAEVWCTAPAFYEACGFERSGATREDGNVHLAADLEAPVREVVVTGEIRLGQLLKLAGLVDTGNEAKELIANGDVLVNDEVETRRGRQMTAGDLVATRDQSIRIVT